MQDRSVKPARGTAVLATALPTGKLVAASVGILVTLVFVAARAAASAFAQQGEASTAQQAEVSYSDDFQSYGTQENPAGTNPRIGAFSTYTAKTFSATPRRSALASRRHSRADVVLPSMLPTRA